MSLYPPDLPASILRACFADAERAFPREACGLLSGPKDSAVIDVLRVCKNDQDRLHALDPGEFPRDGRTAYRLGFVDVSWLNASLATNQPVKIIYHSHVEVGAALSNEDRQQALGFGQPHYPVDQLVIDTTVRGVCGAKRYRFVAGDFRLIAAYDAEGELLCEASAD